METAKTVTDFAGRSVNSQSRHWCTPPKYVDAVRKVFRGKIALDPCSNAESIVHAETEFHLPESDGLHEEWDYETVYVNPPYGADRARGTTIKDWLSKCACSHAAYGAEIIALIPVATNTTHWKKFVFGAADAVCFLYDTRLRFLVNGSTDKRVFQEFGAVLGLENLKETKQRSVPQELLLFA